MSAVEVRSVWKSYPRWVGRERTLRGAFAERLSALTRRHERRWVLRDVSLEVARGQSLGIIGRNGAGKSTLLRLASGISRADRGTISAPEGLAAVLSLGDTFDATLSGTENAYTAALVAGWSRTEARALVRAALDFAELEEAAVAPIRSYSDGMKLRLAFGVVSQLAPTALVIDEVIAVGDLAFQAKCLEWVREQRAQGTPLMLASHDLRLVEHECDRAVWLEDGAVAATGEAGEVVERYEEAARQRTIAATPKRHAVDDHGLELGRNRVGTQEARIESVRLLGAGGEELPASPRSPGRIATGDPLRISLAVEGEATLRDPIMSVAIHREQDDMTCVEANTRDDGVALGSFRSGRATLTFERLDLAPGRYAIDLGLYRADWDVVYDFHWHAIVLEVGDGPTPSRAALSPPRHWELDA